MAVPGTAGTSPQSAVPGTAGTRPHSGQEPHKVAKSGQGWLRVARSAQAWLRGILRPISPDSGGDWIYSGLQIQKGPMGTCGH